MNKRKTNWAILGCGKIARKFAEDLLLAPGANLYAVASRDQVKADHFKQTFEAEVSFGSYEAMVLDPLIDIVYIATPHMFHKEHTLLCLKNNLAVLCEKAFAMNQEEVEEMIAFAKAQNVFLMEALWTHFVPHYKFVLQTVESGAYGNIISLKADFGFNAPFDPASRLYNMSLGGGSLLDVGIYPLFAALTLVGYTENISAKAHIGPTGVDHNCSMTLVYEDGVKASLFSAIDTQTDTTCVITLERGEIFIHSRFHDPTAVTVTAQGISKTHDFPIPEGVNGYYYEILHCQEMLAAGNIESTTMTFKKSLELIKMLDKVRSEIHLNY